MTLIDKHDESVTINNLLEYYKSIGGKTGFSGTFRIGNFISGDIELIIFGLSGSFTARITKCPNFVSESELNIFPSRNIEIAYSDDAIKQFLNCFSTGDLQSQMRYLSTKYVEFHTACEKFFTGQNSNYEIVHNSRSFSFSSNKLSSKLETVIAPSNEFKKYSDYLQSLSKFINAEVHEKLVCEKFKRFIQRETVFSIIRFDLNNNFDIDPNTDLFIDAIDICNINFEI